MFHEFDEHGTPTNSPRWNPPPHLEARFSKRQRRRSGQHSPSTHHGHLGQSVLTPANLASTRRQSILEARKIALRQRAAHVEKVRRMQANSHKEVAERLKALQKNMSQVQKSRNAILAKIAGNCATEVARAKKLAMETKKRREEQTMALKSSVDDRMAEAQRRREEALKERGRKRRERGSSSSLKNDGSSEEDNVSAQVNAVRKEASKMREDDAVRMIQRVWRRHKDATIVKAFTDLGLTIESVRDADFVSISRKFQDGAAVNATAALLKRCGLLPEEGDAASTEKSCRTFLSAYLILGHPGDVLSNDGDNEKALITKSKDLLIAFESFLSSPTFPPPADLALAWSDFSSAFDAWKARDSEMLVNIMVAQYAELDLIWQKVKDSTDEHVTEDYRQGIRENQLMLLVRIRRLAGDKTRDLIKAAVKEARRTRLQRKDRRDTQPREAPTAADASAVSTSTETAEVAQPSSASAQSAGPNNSQMAMPDIVEDGIMSNRQMIHELALDPDFRLKPRKKNNVERMVEEQAKRAFWDVMREDINSGELAKWIPGLAETVKSKLLRLLDPKGSVYRAVSESIDPDLIRQQCEAGSYNHEALLSYVLNLLPKICSPARDEDVKSLCEDTGDYISRLQRLLDVLEAMQLDHANFLLMLSAPTVVPEAIPYERRIFAADLATGRTKLDKTRQWLLKAKEEIQESAPSPSPSPAEIHTHAFLNTVFSLDPVSSDDIIPETYHMDHFRIREVREHIRCIVLGAAIGITIKTMMRRDVRSGWKELKGLVEKLLKGSKPPAEIAQEVKNFVETSSACPPAMLSSIESATQRIVERKRADPVVRVVMGRIRGFVKARLEAKTSKDKVRLASKAGDTLAGFGLVEWIHECVGLTDRLEKWKTVDAECYDQWYNQILGVAE